MGHWNLRPYVANKLSLPVLNNCLIPREEKIKINVLLLYFIFLQFGLRVIVENRSRNRPKGGFPVMAETTRKLAASTR